MSLDPVAELKAIRVNMERIEADLPGAEPNALDRELIQIYKRFVPLMSNAFRPSAELKAAAKNQANKTRIQDCFARCTDFLKSKTLAGTYLPSWAPTLSQMAPTWFAYESTTEKIVRSVRQGWDDVAEELKGAAPSPKKLTEERLSRYK